MGPVRTQEGAIDVCVMMDIEWTALGNDVSVSSNSMGECERVLAASVSKNI